MSDNNPGSPVREYRTIVQDSGDPGYTNRVLIGIATTGLVRVEWVGARYGQVIPNNWSQVEMQEWMNSYIPLHYQVADAHLEEVGHPLHRLDARLASQLPLVHRRVVQPQRLGKRALAEAVLLSQLPDLVPECDCSLVHPRSFRPPPYGM